MAQLERVAQKTKTCPRCGAEPVSVAVKKSPLVARSESPFLAS